MPHFNSIRLPLKSLPKEIANRPVGTKVEARATFEISGLHKDEFGVYVTLDLKQFDDVSMEAASEAELREFLLGLNRAY